MDNSRDKAPRWVQIGLLVLIVYSIVTTALETMPELADYETFFFVSEVVVVVVFTLEYVIFWVLDEKRATYPFRPISIVDLLAILPFYLRIGIDLRSLRALRLLRVFRVLKVARYSRALDTLGEAVRRAWPELVAVGFIAVVVILISAMGLYYAEHDAQPEVYRSIPHSLWWAVVTLTTVGYGDVYPVTVAGRWIAGAIMLLGIGLVAVPAGIISSTLTEIIRERKGPSGGNKDPDPRQVRDA